MRGAKIRKKTPRTAFRLLCLLPPGPASPRSRSSSLLPFVPSARLLGFRRSVLCPPFPLIFSCPRSRSSVPPTCTLALPRSCPSFRLPGSSVPAAALSVRRSVLSAFRQSVLPVSSLPGLAASLSPAPSGRVENGKTKAEGPKTLRRIPCLPLPAARYSIRSVNSRVWGGVQTWSSQLCQPTVQVAVPVPLPLTGSVSVTSFS